MHAVILAAGLGTRLGGRTPKPLTEIAPGRTLLNNQVKILGRLLGRDRIALALGHEAMRFIETYPDLMYVYNPRYSETNTAKTLLAALRKIDDDVLWVNGDLYFETPAARRLLEADQLGSRLLVNRAATDDEEIKYRLDASGAVAELSKTVREPAGESLGMQVVARDDRPALLEQLEQVGDQDYFEKALENCVRGGTMRLDVVDVGGDFCREVDYPEDLQAVRTHLRESGDT